MAGLLDALNTDEARLGLSLLAAGGYSPTPMSFGQRVQSAFQGQDAFKQNKQKSNLLDMQMKNFESEIEARKLAGIKDARQQALIASVFGPGGAGQTPEATSPGAFSPSVDGMGPTMPPQMQQPARQGGLAGMTPDMVARLKLGGLDLTDIYKFSQEPQKFDAGAIYKDRNTGAERFIPKVGEGIAADRNGFYSALPGYAAAQGSIEGAKTSGVEAAKAGFDLVEITAADGAKYFVPRASVLANQPRPQQPAAPATTPSRAGNPMRSQPGESDQFAILSQELAKAKASGNTADVASLEREISRLPASAKTGASASGLSTPGFQASPTTSQANDAAADKEYQVGAVKDILETRKTIMNAGFSAPSSISKYKQLGKLLQDVDGGTLTATGTNIASTMNSLGFKIDKNLSNKEAAQALGNEMALDLRNPANGAGMPGAMSDGDREFLVKMTPNASQSAEGRKQLIDAKIAVEERKIKVAAFARNYEKKYGRLDNGFFEQLSAWSAQNEMFKGK